MNYKLILLDIDGTLCDRDSVEIYPATRRFIESLDPSVDVALVTNQGGPPCERAGWEFSHQFPSLEAIEARLGNIASQIGDIRDKKVGLYVAYYYQVKGGAIIGLSGPITNEWEHQHALYWRKPGPGMILKAMENYGVTPDQTLMIGDRPEDEQAAQAAGVASRHVDNI